MPDKSYSWQDLKEFTFEYLEKQNLYYIGIDEIAIREIFDMATNDLIRLRADGENDMRGSPVKYFSWLAFYTKKLKPLLVNPPEYAGYLAKRQIYRARFINEELATQLFFHGVFYKNPEKFRHFHVSSAFIKELFFSLRYNNVSPFALVLIAKSILSEH